MAWSWSWSWELDRSAGRASPATGTRGQPVSFRGGVGIALLVLATACGTSAPHDIAYDVEWFEEPQSAPVSREAIGSLMAEPWVDDIEVRIQAPGEDRMHATLGSCSDYFAVADQRPRPIHGATTHVIFQARALHCQAARLAMAAQPATISHLRTLAFDEGLPDHLPWQVAMIISSSEHQQIARERPKATWRAALFSPLTTFSPCGTHCGVYAEPGQTQSVWLLARGDFDGDGIEDVLLQSSDAAIGGSYQAVRMFVLTRRQPGARIELVQEFDY